MVDPFEHEIVAGFQRPVISEASSRRIRTKQYIQNGQVAVGRSAVETRIEIRRLHHAQKRRMNFCIRRKERQYGGDVARSHGLEVSGDPVCARHI